MSNETIIPYLNPEVFSAITEDVMVFLYSESTQKGSMPYGKTAENQCACAGGCPYSGIPRHDIALHH